MLIHHQRALLMFRPLQTEQHDTCNVSWTEEPRRWHQHCRCQRREDHRDEGSEPTVRVDMITVVTRRRSGERERRPQCSEEKPFMVSGWHTNRWDPKKIWTHVSVVGRSWMYFSIWTLNLSRIMILTHLSFFFVLGSFRPLDQSYAAR